MPPDGTNCAEYGVPTLPGGSFAGVALMVETCCLNLPLAIWPAASITFSQYSYCPGVVAMPPTEFGTPFPPASNRSPSGRDDPGATENVNGARPPRTNVSSAWLNGTPGEASSNSLVLRMRGVATPAGVTTSVNPPGTCSTFPAVSAIFSPTE